MKIITIIGARPQFVKAAVISRALRTHNANITEKIIHTGQHYDKNMSDIFFEEMSIPKPNYNLKIGGGTHGENTGRMLEGIEKILLKEKPDWVLVYGDTDSTLAGALSAAKLHIPIAHIEAGLRSFNMRMPEEINRMLTDRVSSILFCPTTTAVNNLKAEGYDNLSCNVVMSGDVMHDAALFYENKAVKPSINLEKNYVLSTIHRAENTDDLSKLKDIINALNAINEKKQVVLPLHPRTKAILKHNNVEVDFTTMDPVGYLEMVYLIKNSSMIMTDSGGLQKEAFFFKKPCITLREETEWVELIENNYNVLTGSNNKLIIDKYHNYRFNNDYSLNLYGNGSASKMITEILIK